MKNKSYSDMVCRAIYFNCTLYNTRKQTLIVQKLDDWRVTRISANPLETPEECGAFASRIEAEKLCEEILRLQSFTKVKN